MDKRDSAERLRRDMNAHGLRFRKSLGQNFLTDGDILSQIAAAASLEDGDCVLEIGPGAGALTRVLAAHSRKVVAVEIDSGLLPLLSENTAEFDNVTVINADILKLDLPSFFAEHFPGKRVKVVANLPYYITTPIIMKLLEEKSDIAEIVIMIQKEVAERLCAQPGTKEYGAVTLGVNYRAHPSPVCLVPPTAFVPPPKVWSAVLRLEILEKPPVSVLNEDFFFKVIKAAFAQRRKTFVNSVSSAAALGICKEDVKKVLNKLCISENVRGETFDLVEFAQISNELFQLTLCK